MPSCAGAGEHLPPAASGEHGRAAASSAGGVQSLQTGTYCTATENRAVLRQGNSHLLAISLISPRKQPAALESRVHCTTGKQRASPIATHPSYPPSNRTFYASSTPHTPCSPCTQCAPCVPCTTFIACIPCVPHVQYACCTLLVPHPPHAWLCCVTESRTCAHASPGPLLLMAMHLFYIFAPSPISLILSLQQRSMRFRHPTPLTHSMHPCTPCRLRCVMRSQACARLRALPSQSCSRGARAQAAQWMQWCRPCLKVWLAFGS